MIQIQFIKNENRAVAYDNNKEIGECEFIETENVWNIIHTGVDIKYQGKGIAKDLVNCIIENAKKWNKNLISECSYAKKVLETSNIDRRRG